MSKNIAPQGQLSLFGFVDQWFTHEYMPGHISYLLNLPTHQIHASVDPCYPDAYTYYVIKNNADNSTTRLKHWLETGKKHKVSLEEGKRICEEAITARLEGLA